LHNSDSFASKNSTGSTNSQDWRDGSKDGTKEMEPGLKPGEDPLCQAVKEGAIALFVCTLLFNDIYFLFRYLFLFLN
jgi:hypothetical protein